MLAHDKCIKTLRFHDSNRKRNLGKKIFVLYFKAVIHTQYSITQLRVKHIVDFVPCFGCRRMKSDRSLRALYLIHTLSSLKLERGEGLSPNPTCRVLGFRQVRFLILETASYPQIPPNGLQFALKYP